MRPSRLALGATLALLPYLSPPAALASAPGREPTTAVPPAADDWVARSDAHAQVLLDALARFSPEFAGFLGIEDVDEQVLDLKPQFVERQAAALRVAQAELEARLPREQERRIQQDLQILIDAARDQLEVLLVTHAHQVPVIDVAQTVFQGMRALLDDQVPAERRARAVVRLQRYVGLEPGFEPLAELAMARTREALVRPALSAPFRGELEKNLGNSQAYVDGCAKLLARYDLDGWQEAHAKLAEQIAAWDSFVRDEVLPRARTDFRLVPAVYAVRLKEQGVHIPPEVLADRARIAFIEIRNEMQALARLIARERSLPSSDYRDVLRELKREQLVGEAILPHYQERLRQLEDVIRRERIITLPERPARIRLASEAESAAIPAPNMRPPRLIGNRGEIGEFVLPLRVPTTGADGRQELKGFDDFTFEAASWTLTAHEARPGHELQFASVVEKGVSLARSIFAFNGVNIEGWGLYAEAEMKPYLPLEGQLVALQHRMLRAARAFLDPELQLGRTSPEQALRVLMDEAGFSEPMSKQEVDRYTFFSPGQATSYFYGYQRWLQLRARAELALGPRFDRQRYHDFLLGQGFLPPDVLEGAVMEEFVPAERARAVAQARRGWPYPMRLAAPR